MGGFIYLMAKSGPPEKVYIVCDENNKCYHAKGASVSHGCVYFKDADDNDKPVTLCGSFTKYEN
mgnify:CR=1 FL=1